MRISRLQFNQLWKSSAVAVLLLCGASPMAMADELKECLIVHMHSGERTSYVLEDTPKVTFVDDKLHVETAVLSDDHALADVEKFTFDKVASLGAVATGECRITVENRIVTIEGIAPASVVVLADMQGRNLASVSADQAGMARLSLASCPDGVYLVSLSDGKTFKILNK